MICDKCGAQINNDEQFCYQCGARILGTEPDKQQVRRSKKIWPYIAGAGLLTLIIVGAILFFVSGNKGKSYEDQLALAERYFDELEYDKAIAAYKAVLEIDPMNEAALNGLEQCYISWAESEPDKAGEIYEEAETSLERLMRKNEEAEEVLVRIERKIAYLVENKDKIVDSEPTSGDKDGRSDSDENTDKGDGVTEEDGSNDTGESEEKDPGEPDKSVNDERWKQVYRKVLEDHVKQYIEYGYGEFYPGASLIYIDDDNIPEMLFDCPTSAFGGLYSCVDGEAVSIGDGCWAAYIPKEGLFFTHDGTFGGQDVVRRWDGKTSTILWTGSYYGETEEGNVVWIYNYDGKVVSEDEYRKELGKYYDESKEVHIHYDMTYDEIMRYLE